MGGGQKEPQIFVGRYVVPYMFVGPHILVGRSSHTCRSVITYLLVNGHTKHTLLNSLVVTIYFGPRMDLLGCKSNGTVSRQYCFVTNVYYSRKEGAKHVREGLSNDIEI